MPKPEPKKRLVDWSYQPATIHAIQSLLKPHKVVFHYRKIYGDNKIWIWMEKVKRKR